MFPETIVSLVNAVRLAMRMVISNGEMTCFGSARLDNPISQQSSTNLSRRDDLQEDVLGLDPGSPRGDKQQKTDSVKGRRFDEDGYDGLVQSVRSD